MNRSGRQINKKELSMEETLKITGRVTATLKNINTGEVQIYKYNNLVVTSGKVAIGRRLANIAEKTSEGMVTYGAVGTGTNAPAAGDIKLQVEIARKQVSSSSYVSNVATIRVFFNTSEGNGTLKEFGLFGEEATAAADSGTLFNRVAVNITKSSSDTLTFSCDLTIS
jgi:hypothetical protein